MHYGTVIAGACVLMHCATANAAALPSKSAVANYASTLLKRNYSANGPGAELLVARGDRILFQGARGLADVKRGIRIGPDDLFDIASLTKQFVAASILRLVEAGTVSLDDPISRYVKAYPGGDQITLGELLNHTSGIANYTDNPDLAGKPLSEGQMIDALKNAPPAFAPGAGWAYDNSGYVLLGAVVEATTHMSWFDYVQKTLLQPLGLTHTGYIGDPSVAQRMVHGYSLVDGKPVDTGEINRRQPYADGALVSNVGDLLRWNRALHEGKVLKTATYRAMITPNGGAVSELYGYGIRNNRLRGQSMLDHSGHVTGYSAFLLYLPATRTSVAILQNVDPDASLSDTPTTARRLAAFAIGKPYPPIRPVSLPAERLLADQGVFGSDSPRILRMIDGTMTIARVGEARKALVPTGPDSFASTGSFDRVELEHDAHGKVVALRFLADGEEPAQRLARTEDPFPQQVKLDRAALERVTGTYGAEGLKVRVSLSAGKVTATVEGDPRPATLLAQSANDFVMAELDGSATFSNEERPSSMTLRQGHEQVALKRLPN